MHLPVFGSIIDDWAKGKLTGPLPHGAAPGMLSGLGLGLNFLPMIDAAPFLMGQRLDRVHGLQARIQTLSQRKAAEEQFLEIMRENPRGIPNGTVYPISTKQGQSNIKEQENILRQIDEEIRRLTEEMGKTRRGE